jgi:hypothetical protein
MESYRLTIKEKKKYNPVTRDVTVQIAHPTDFERFVKYNFKGYELVDFLLLPEFEDATDEEIEAIVNRIVGE